MPKIEETAQVAIDFEAPDLGPDTCTLEINQYIYRLECAVAQLRIDLNDAKVQLGLRDYLISDY